jgi:hypothetical protein
VIVKPHESGGMPTLIGPARAYNVQVLMRRYFTPLTAIVLVVGGMTACGSTTAKKATESTTTVAGKEKGLTPDQAAVLSNVLKKNYDSVGSKFVAQVPYGPAATFTLTGQVDFVRGFGGATLKSEVVGQPPVDTQVFWQPAEVAEELEGLTAGMSANGRDGVKYLVRTLTKNSAQDIVLQFISGLGVAQAENPQLIQQGDAAYITRETLRGNEVDVFRFGKTIYYIRAADGMLDRVEANLAVSQGIVTIDFMSHEAVNIVSPPLSEVVDVSQVPPDLLGRLTGRPSTTAGPELPTTTAAATAAAASA